ncbi:hypothetical protein LT493_22795 [Streptomyces tricolor]|nr:hypothetical protein [Streptomyces tricolor]
MGHGEPASAHRAEHPCRPSGPRRPGGVPASGDIFVATGPGNGATRLWNVRDPRRPSLAATLPGHTHVVTSTAFSPDGDTLATTGDTTAVLWDVTDPARPRRLDVLRGHTDTMTSVAFSPDGRTVATGGWDPTRTDLVHRQRPADARPPVVLRPFRDRLVGGVLPRRPHAHLDRRIHPVLGRRRPRTPPARRRDSGGAYQAAFARTAACSPDPTGC